MLRCQHILLGLAVTLCCGASFAQYSSNMFLNGEYQNGIKANPSKSNAISPATNIFLEHAIISRQASPFKGPTYLPPEEILKCSAGKQCVLQGQCLDGYFSNPSLKAQVSGSKNSLGTNMKMWLIEQLVYTCICIFCYLYSTLAYS